MMLTDVLPAQYRKGFYAAYALIGVILGAIQVAYLNIAGQPVWLTVALAVFGFVGTAFGATAASNITANAATGDDLARRVADGVRRGIADVRQVAIVGGGGGGGNSTWTYPPAGGSSASTLPTPPTEPPPAPAKKAPAKKAPAKKAAKNAAPKKPPQG